MTKFLLILLISYLFMRFVMPYIFKWALKAFIKKSIQNGRFTNLDPNAFRSANQPRPEGKVQVDYMPEPPRPKDFPGGEYVDYEEVK